MTLNFGAAVILLQIVMVSPVTHLVKIMSLNALKPMSPSKKKESEIENVWVFM